MYLNLRKRTINKSGVTTKAHWAFTETTVKGKKATKQDRLHTALSGGQWKATFKYWCIK